MTVPGSRVPGSQHNPPPLASLEAPFHEVLVEEVARSVPRPMSEQVRQASTLRELNNWLAASQLYRWLGAQPSLATTFVQRLRGDPEIAARAFMESLAGRLEPPPRTRQWHVCDRLGLALQLLVAILLLAGRGPLVTLLAGSWTSALDAMTNGVLGLRNLAGGIVTPTEAFTLMSGGIWIIGEASVGPRLMEAARWFPAMAAEIPRPRSWRAEPFYVLWFAQATISWGIFSGAIWSQLLDWNLARAVGPGAWPWTAGVLLESVFGLAILVRTVRSSLEARDQGDGAAIDTALSTIRGGRSASSPRFD